MDGQIHHQINAFDESRSFQYRFVPTVSAIAQITLSGRKDFEKWVPISEAIAAWMSFQRAGQTSWTMVPGIRSTVAVNDLREIRGLLNVSNCYAGAVVNFFLWPSVSEGRETFRFPGGPITGGH